MDGGRQVRGGMVLCVSGIVQEVLVNLPRPPSVPSHAHSGTCSGIMGKFVATLRGHVGPVYRLAWSADSRMVVSASKDHTVKVRLISRAIILVFVGP